VGAAKWNYINHGDDWKDIAGYEACGLEM